MFWIGTLLFLCIRCASEGFPSGGPKDEDPPIFVKSLPVPNALNYKGKEVVISFDENVVLKDIFTNFIASPPLEEDPEVKAIGKEVRIELNNKLQDNTTYTLYFGDGIADNNEGNLYTNFTFSFSTGNVIDSLMISGIVLDARNLDPLKNALVGVYSNLNDTAVIKNVPQRIAKTNMLGIFTIKNLPDSNFHIFALQDVDRNYRYNMDGEKFAFLDSVYHPYFDTVQYADTLWADSLTVDTVIFKDTLVYFPDDIVLKAFLPDRFFQNLKKKTRTSKRRVLFEFSSPVIDTPKVELLDTVAENWFYYEASVTRDSLIMWITDSNFYEMDTLRFAFSYQKTDSLSELIWKTDTLELNFRAPQVAERKKKPHKDDEPVVLSTVENFEFTVSVKGSLDVFRPIVLSFPEPVKTIMNDSIHLFEVQDSITIPLKVKLVQDPIMPRIYYIDYKWNEDKRYVFSIDSAAFISIYGAVSDKFKNPFTIKGEDQFSELIFHLENVPGNGIVELLDAKDTPIKSLPFTAINPTVKFAFLEPGAVYARLFIDENGNGVWDTGNYLEHKQAEKVYYFDKEIVLKQNWTVDEVWDIFKLPIHKQKPQSLRNLEKDTKKR